MISLENIGKYYQVGNQQLTVLSDVNLFIPAGLIAVTTCLLNFLAGKSNVSLLPVR